MPLSLDGGGDLLVCRDVEDATHQFAQGRLDGLTDFVLETPVQAGEQRVMLRIGGNRGVAPGDADDAELLDHDFLQMNVGTSYPASTGKGLISRPP